MIDDVHPNDDVLTLELRESLSGLAVRERPPLEAIVNRARVHRRRQRGGLASVGVVAAAAAAALALGLTGVHNAAPKNDTSTQNLSANPGTIRTAAFTLVSYSNGRVKLTLTNSQVFDPTELQRALAKDGIPALVKSDVYCSSDPAPPDPAAIGVLSSPPLKSPAGLAPPKNLQTLYPARSPRPSLRRLINNTVTVINPVKMPPGTELAFDYAPGKHLLSVNLVYKNSHTCRSGQPPAH